MRLDPEGLRFEYSNMSQELAAVYEELTRLKQAGLERVSVAPETLEIIKAQLPEATPKPTERHVEPASPKETEHTPEIATEPAAVTETAKPPAPTFPSPPVVELPKGDAIEQLSALRRIVEQCETCQSQLSENGKIVFGSGSPQADILFCGEAPGADEAKAGEPFIGNAGQLLSKIIAAMGLDRDSIYITNILKWRPEHHKPYGNRPPTIEEMQFCLPYFEAQIEIIKPKVIVALGNTAVSGLLGSDPERRMGQVRGKWHRYADIDLMITFHPAYLLRNDTLKTKRMVWEDMLSVMRKCDMSISEQQEAYFLPKAR